MKPDFALSLSFEGIGLLHRSAEGWTRIKEVPLDTPDLSAALATLRAEAEALGAAPLTAKLLLPEEQIKYLHLTAPADISQDAAVRAALEGATPYPLDELAYDFAQSETGLNVAAVARETLHEAEAFARENGFEPVFFAATPNAQTYPGEPFFGYCQGHGPAPESADDSPEAQSESAPLPPEPQAAPKELRAAEAVAFSSRRSVPAEDLPSVAVPPAPRAAPAPALKTGAQAPQAGPTQTGKPRHLGLVLTAILLLFLLGIAAWASVFAGEGLSRLFGRERAPVQTALSEPDVTDIEGEEAMLAQPPQLAEPPTDTPASPQLAAPLSPREAQEKYAVTGIWVLPPDALPPPALRGEDELYIASIDSGIRAQDAIALPPLALESLDQTPGRQTDPAPQGQSFVIDENGLVIATPQGALSPDGHLVFAGQPPNFPKEIPARLEGPAAVEPAVAQLRPQVRPEGLALANERAVLGGMSREELAAIRPRPRPANLPQQSAALAVSETLSTAIEDAVAAAVPQSPPTDTDLDPNATAQAVARSVKPKDRPKNFETIIQKAEKDEESEGLTEVAAVAPRTVSPAIPSRASVAKQATERNAINLRRVNLIGVYGKPSSRRALVRLSNGRYKKVAVGDRIDGGRVSAIGDTELRYQKNGRDVTLKMPRG